MSGDIKEKDEKATRNRCRNVFGGDTLPDVMVLKKWNWPVGVSISQVIGYQRSQFSEDTWTFELRPIVDKQRDRRII